MELVQKVGWTLDAPKKVGKIGVHFISNFLEKENTRVNTPMGEQMPISDAHYVQEMTHDQWNPNPFGFQFFSYNQTLINKLLCLDIYTLRPQNVLLCPYIFLLRLEILLFCSYMGVICAQYF